MVTFTKELKRIPRGDVPDPQRVGPRPAHRCDPFRAGQHGALLDPEKECPG